MTLIVVCLLLGITIGALGVLPKPLLQFVGRISNICLLVMLTSLGAKLGAQPGILERIGSLGTKAFVLAIFAIFGALVPTIFLQRSARKKSMKQDGAKVTSSENWRAG